MIICRSIHLAANSIISFFLMANIPLYICTTSAVFIFPVSRRLGWVHVLAIVQWTLVHVSFQSVLFSRCMPWSRTAGSYDSSIFGFFKEPPNCSLQRLYQFTFPPTMEEASFFSTLPPAFVICKLSGDGHSDWCEAISHCSFDLHLSNN